MLTTKNKSPFDYYTATVVLHWWELVQKWFFIGGGTRSIHKDDIGMVHIVVDVFSVGPDVLPSCSDVSADPMVVESILTVNLSAVYIR
jgi:hypothetical protein